MIKPTSPHPLARSLLFGCLLLSWWSCSRALPTQEPTQELSATEPIVKVDAGQTDQTTAPDSSPTNETQADKRQPDRAPVDLPVSDKALPETGPEPINPREEPTSERRPEFPNPPEPKAQDSPHTKEMTIMDAAASGIDWASLQWPPQISIKVGQETPWIYGQVYIKGVTTTPGTTRPTDLRVEFGHGPFDQDPRAASQQWTWTNKVEFHKRTGPNNNNHEYRAKLKPVGSGFYRYAVRYSLKGGPWQVADRGDYGRKGTDDGVSLEQMGLMSVVQTGALVRVASLNLHCLIDQPTKRLTEIAREIKREKIDLLVLQEVCLSASGGAHSAQQLSNLLKSEGAGDYHPLFEATHTAQHSGASFQEGLGILSRFPIGEHRAFALPPNTTPPTGAFPRKALWARVATPVGILSLASTHLSYRREHDWWRDKQVQALKMAMAEAEVTANGLLVGGDFNASPTETSVQLMSKANQPAMTPSYTDLLLKFDANSTFPSRGPSIRIDYLFFSQPAGSPIQLETSTAKRVFTKPIGGLYLSDHVGVMAELKAK